MTVSDNWASVLDAHVSALVAEAKADAKSFFPPRGDGLQRVQGDIGVLRAALQRLEAINRAS